MSFKTTPSIREQPVFTYEPHRNYKMQALISAHCRWPSTPPTAMANELASGSLPRQQESPNSET